MKKLLLIVAMIAGGLVINAQDVQSKKGKSTQNEKNNKVEDQDNLTDDDDDQDDQNDQQQDETSQNVPSKAKETLDSKYPDAKDVEWEKEGSQYEAEFTVGESEYTVMFDSSGKWSSTKVDNIALNEVPRKVKDGIQKSEYKGWEIDEVDFLDSPEKSTYKVEVKKGIKEKELTVDKNGNILKKGDKSSM